MNSPLHTLQKLLAERVTTGLRQKSIKTRSEWSEEYRVMGAPFPGPWRTTHHPWLKAMLDCDSEIMCAKKAAQMGVTEVALNKTFAAIDLFGDSVLYILPASTPDASDFSSARFDPALEMSPHLNNLFSDVKNVGHKRAGNANLFIRGSRSRSQLKSVPVSLIIEDEKDEMLQENLTLIPERMSGQVRKQLFSLSTPTIDKLGIDKDFRESDQQHFHFKCPHCSRFTEFDHFDNCLIITAEEVTDPRIKDSHYICKECKHPLAQEEKINFLAEGNTEWVKSYDQRISAGFYINQLYSMTIKPYHFAASVLRAQGDELEEQELMNSKMGMTHATKGSQISDKMLDLCEGGHLQRNVALNGKLITTIGIDVGKVIHFEVDEWYIDEYPDYDINLSAKPRLVQEGFVKEFEELDGLMHSFGVWMAVIDANPETRKSREFCRRWPGSAYMCYYSRGATSREIVVKEEENSINVDRTSWLDLALSRFKNGRIILPKDLSMEYKDHVKEPVRVIKKDSNGNPTAIYLNADADHLAHARNYSEIALKLATSRGSVQDVSEVM